MKKYINLPIDLIPYRNSLAQYDPHKEDLFDDFAYFISLNGIFSEESRPY